MIPPPSSCAVVPARPLRGLPVALEHPVAELAAHRKDLAEETAVAQHLQLQEAGQPELVLHHAVLDAGFLRRLVEVHGLGKRRRDRLLAVDMLARGDRALQERRAQLRGGGIEEDFVLRILQRLGEIGGPALDAAGLGERLKFFGAAPDQDRIGDEPRAVGEAHAAFVADRDDRTHEVLVCTHAPRDTVHDDADALLFHADSPLRTMDFIADQSGRTRLA